MKLITLTPEQKNDHQIWIKHFEDKYSFEFLNPAYEKVPFVSQFFDDKKIAEKISKLEYFLLGTYPIDMGTNVHKEMCDLRYKFTEEEYEWHQRHNKLGLNCWGNQAGIGLMTLNDILGRDDLYVAKSFPTTEEYSSMSFEKKLQLCISVDKKLYNLLDKLYADYN